MSAAFDPQGDLPLAADGLETVTLFRRGVISGASGQAVAHALRRNATMRALGPAGTEADARTAATSDAAAGTGACPAVGQAVWHLPAEELSQAPEAGDVILDGQHRRWTVLDAQSAALGSRWRCLARCLALAFALDDTVSVLRAEHTKGQAGAAAAVWRVWRTGLRARVQPVESGTAAEHALRRPATRWRILLEDHLLLDERHRIQTRDGRVYRVRRTIAPQQIGEPLVVEVELLP